MSRGGQPTRRRSSRRWDPRPVRGEERRRWLGHLEQRYGIPVSVFDGFALVQPNVSKLAVVPRDLEPPALPAAVFQGMLLLHTNMGQPKPSTPAAMTFGPHATRHVVALDDAQCRTYLAREDVHPTATQLAACQQPGWVLVRQAGGEAGGATPPSVAPPTGGVPAAGRILGVGQWVRQEGPARLRSQYPKAWAIRPRAPSTPAPGADPGAAGCQERP